MCVCVCVWCTCVRGYKPYCPKPAAACTVRVLQVPVAMDSAGWHLALAFHPLEIKLFK